MYCVCVETSFVHSKAVVLLLLIHRLLLLPLFVGVCVRSLFCYAVFCVLPSFAMISLGKREKAGYFTFIVFLKMFCSYSCSYIFLVVPWVDLQCVLWHFLVLFTYLLRTKGRNVFLTNKFLLLPYHLSSISIYAGTMNALKVAQTVSNTYFGCRCIKIIAEVIEIYQNCRKIQYLFIICSIFWGHGCIYKAILLCVLP